MLYEFYTKHRKSITIIIVALLAIIIVLILTRREPLVVTDTNLEYNPVATQLINNNIYRYNGISFTKTGLNKNDSTVTLGGSTIKLPHISNLLWAGDKGVLVNFDFSYINTAIASRPEIKNVPFDTYRAYTWYIDFSDDSIRLVDTAPIYENLSYFDTKAQTLYYVAGALGGAPIDGIRSLDITTSTLEKIPGPEMSDILSLRGCKKSLCYVARPLSKPSNYAVYESTKKDTYDTKKETNNPIIPINNSSWYLTFEDPLEVDEVTPPIYNKVIFNDSSLENKAFSIKRETDPNNILVFKNDMSFVLYGDKQGKYTTIYKNVFKRYAQKDMYPVNNEGVYDKVIVNRGQANDGSLLFNAVDTSAKLLQPSEPIANTFNRSSDEAKKALGNCDATYLYIDQIKLFSIRIADKPGFEKEITRIGTCLKEKSSQLYGYDYMYDTISEVNGRVTSD